MRLPFFSTDPLLRLLRVKSIATLPDLQRALGSQVPLTVFRKLKEFGLSNQLLSSGPFLHPRPRRALRQARSVVSRFGVVLPSWNPGGYRRGLRQPFSFRLFRCRTGGRAPRVRAGPPAASGGTAPPRSATRVWLVPVLLVGSGHTSAPTTGPAGRPFRTVRLRQRDRG